MEPPEGTAEFQVDPGLVVSNGIHPHVPTPPDPEAVPERRPGRSPFVTFLLIGTLLAVVAPFLAYLIAIALHAGPFGNRVFPVTLHNDTGQALVVRGCGNNCTAADQAVDLAAGASIRLGATTGQMTRFYLHAPTGEVLGCLPLQYPRVIAGLTIQASQQEVCPGNPLPAS